MALTVGILTLPVLTAKNSLSYFEGAPPLGPAYVAAAARAAGHRVVVLDALGEALDRFSPFPSTAGELVLQGYPVDEIVARLPDGLDVLGISNLFLHEVGLLRALLPRLRARFPHLPIVAGGENASGMWEDLLRLLPELTAVVIGEGEETFVRLCGALEAGEDLATVPSLGLRVDGVPHATPRAARIRAVDTLPRPAWDLFPVERYLAHGVMSGVDRGRSLPVLTSRGCPFSCSFCSAPTMWGTTYVPRDPAQVVDEIAQLMRTYGITNVDFRDLTAALTKKWIRAFHSEVTTRGLHFTWQIPQGTRSENLDREALTLLYESGLRNFGYALESVSPAVISRMRKKVVPQKLFASVAEALRLPLHLEVFFIIGYPGETRADHLAYLKAAVRLAWMGMHAISVIPFNPYPGSADYRRLRDAGQITFDDGFFYTSLLRTRGQAPAVQAQFSTRYLVAFELACLIVFYAVQFLTRPWRLLRVASNLLHARQETILDQFLAVKTRQWLGRGRRWRPARAASRA